MSRRASPIQGDSRNEGTEVRDTSGRRIPGSSELRSDAGLKGGRRETVEGMI